jgi:NAD-dependent deacetylase sirtuin 2
MGANISLPPISAEEEKNVLNYDCSVKGLAKYIEDGKARKIVLMTGAGISVSAGIPDFRTPGSGLYDNLKKYKLPKPEAMFDIEYFRKNPAPFYDLARSLFPTNYNPTPAHFFIKLLEKKGLLLRCYTQNIDTLERQAGIDSELLVEAHGGFGSAHCTRCGKKYSLEYCRERIMDKTDKITNDLGEVIPWCLCEDPNCNGNVKPDIVFFGENLPTRYFELREADLLNADLLIVLGTSLKVSPFNSTMDYCNPAAPRFLINRERVRMIGEDFSNGGFKFDLSDNYRDVELLTDCDEGVFILCELLGWKNELVALIQEHIPDWNEERFHHINKNDLLQDNRITRIQISDKREDQFDDEEMLRQKLETLELKNDKDK